jgi:hypothetical protein
MDASDFPHGEAGAAERQAILDAIPAIDRLVPITGWFE